MGLPIDPIDPWYLPGEYCPLCWAAGQPFENTQTPSAVMVKLSPDNIPDFFPNPLPEYILLVQTLACSWNIPKPDNSGWYGGWVPDDREGFSYLSISYCKKGGAFEQFFYQATTPCVKFFDNNTLEAGGTAEIVFTDVARVFYQFIVGVLGRDGHYERFPAITPDWWFRAANMYDHTVVHIKLIPALIFPYRKHVTGTISPDSTGDYDHRGVLYEQMFYKRETGGFSIWWDGTDSWIISVIVGATGTNYHKRTDPGIIGAYAPQGAATGLATVGRGYA